MHPYATDSTERIVIPLGLAAASIVSAFALSWIIDASGLQPLLWWLEVPSVVGFYGLYFKIFDVRLWRADVLRTVGLIKVPDLSGCWKGAGESLYDDSGTRTPFDCEITIEQRWTTLRVSLSTKTSRSVSHIGALLVTGKSPSLTYEYLNEPRAVAVSSMNMHRGVARLEATSSSELDGDYYSGRGRRTFGTLRLRRVE
jgi:hypothetical protein